MIRKIQYKVGDNLYWVPSDPNDKSKTVKIVSVERNKIELSNGIFLNKKTLLSTTYNDSVPLGCCFLSEKEYKDNIEKINKWHTLRNDLMTNPQSLFDDI